MSRPSNQPVDRIQQSAPKAVAPALDVSSAPTLEAEPAQRIPFNWRLVLGIWVAAFAILVVYEVMVNIARFFAWMTS